MKKVLLAAVITLSLLSACGSNGGVEATDVARFSTYTDDRFSMEIPEDWQVITDFPSDFPDETQVIFRNSAQDADFIANVSIVKEDNEKTLTNTDFSQSKLESHANTLGNYDLISQENITLLLKGNDSQTFLNTFQGQTDTSGPDLQYMQTYLTRGDDAWVVTATYEANEDRFVVERMKTMLESFTLR